ncbi:SMC family ATPase [Candidatus Pacearchaeota archaeon]|nr:SMC family ATPase [Candidatus Pacearchaeota archaeon]
MRPLRIYLKNFMNHRETEIEINFQSVLIVGRSNKNDRISNGVGKTTLFRAIEYVLFNQSHATVLEKIIRDGKRKAVVEFEFELDGEIYKIYRHRCDTGASDVRLYKKAGTEWASISGRTPSFTDQEIQKLIKITHKAFTYSVLFRQADLTGITSVADPKKRKEILKEPLNLVPYTKMEELATKRVRPLRKELDRIEGSISMLGNPDIDIKKAEEELATTIEQVKEHRDLIISINATIEGKRLLVEDLKQSLGAQDIDIHRKVTEQESVLKRLKENTKVNDRKLDSISGFILTREERLKKNKEEESTAQFTLNTHLSEEQIDLEEIQQKYDGVCADEVKGSELLAAAKAQIKFIKKSLPDSDECPTCSQSITVAYRQQMETEISERLKKQEVEVEFYEDAIGKCRRKKARLDQTLKAVRSRINEISKLETLIKTLGNEQKSLRDEIDRLYADQKEISKKIQDEERQIQETTTSLEALREAAEKSSAPAINNKIFTLNQEISKHQDEIIDCNRRVSSFSSVQGGLEERIANRKSDKVKLENVKSLLVKTQRELKIRQMVVDAFSNRGIPNFIIQTILGELQFEANVALKELRPELDVQIDAELNFTYRRNGELRDYFQLSHGQHVYIALAFKRGMARVIQKRIGIAINILEFDEVDSHLDEAGVDAFADAIRKWQKDFTIFVITHNKDLKDKFSHAILVEESDDGATGTVVTSW